VPRSFAARAAAATGWGLVILFAAATLSRARLYADEISFWSAASTGEPDSGAARMNLGNALYKAGDRDRAAENYRRALGMTLSDPDRALALTNLGSVLYQEGDRKGAETYLREAASMPQADATVAFNLGALLYQNGYDSQTRGEEAKSAAELGEAAGYLERAVGLDPYHARAWMLLGNCEMAAGHRERARAEWGKVIELDGADGLIGREAALALSRSAAR
jgi:Flp pilus assembly protein TadD